MKTGAEGQHGQRRIMCRIAAEVGYIDAACRHLSKEAICKGILSSNAYVGAGIAKPHACIHGNTWIARGNGPVKQPGLREGLVQLHSGEFQNRHAQGHNVEMFHRSILTAIRALCGLPSLRKRSRAPLSVRNPPASQGRGIRRADKRPAGQAWSAGHRSAAPARQPRHFPAR